MAHCGRRFHVGLVDQSEVHVDRFREEASQGLVVGIGVLEGQEKGRGARGQDVPCCADDSAAENQVFPASFTEAAKGTAGIQRGVVPYEWRARDRPGLARGVSEGLEAANVSEGGDRRGPCPEAVEPCSIRDANGAPGDASVVRAWGGKAPSDVVATAPSARPRMSVAGRRRAGAGLTSETSQEEAEDAEAGKESTCSCRQSPF